MLINRWIWLVMYWYMWQLSKEKLMRVMLKSANHHHFFCYICDFIINNNSIYKCVILHVSSGDGALWVRLNQRSRGLRFNSTSSNFSTSDANDYVMSVTNYVATCTWSDIIQVEWMNEWMNEERNNLNEKKNCWGGKWHRNQLISYCALKASAAKVSVTKSSSRL